MTETSAASTTRLLAIFAGAFGVVVGVSTFVGWFADTPRLTDWDGNGISMFPNTALGAVLAGAALILVARLSAGERSKVAAGFGVVVALIGGLTIFQHLTSVNLGIDTLIISRSWGQNAAAAPMRMGLPASSTFVLLGTALSLAALGRRRAAAMIGLVSVFIPMLGVTAYLLGASTLYTVPRYTGIALQTASVLATLAIGMVAAVPEHGLTALMRRDDAAGVVVRRILPLATLIILVTGWLRVAGENIGLYDSAFGAAIRSVVLIVTFLGLLWWTARAIVSQIEARQATDVALASATRLNEYRLRLSDALRPLHDPSVVKRTAARVLGEYLRANRAFYCDISGQDWVAGETYERDVVPISEGAHSAEDYGPWIMETYRRGELIVFNDTRTDPRFTPAERDAHLAVGIVSALGVPLVKDGELVAILTAHCSESRDWSDDEIALTVETAERTWAAVESATARGALAFQAAEIRRQLIELSSLYAATPAGLCVFDRDFRYTRVNEALAAMNGIPADEHIGKTPYEIVPEVGAAAEKVFREVLETGRPVRFELTGGDRIWDEHWYPVRDESGRVTHVGAVVVDITERKRAELELRQNRERFDIVRDGARVGFWFCDLPFDKLVWDNRVKEHFWLPEDAEVTIETFYSRIHPDDREPTRLAIEASIADHTPYEIEYRTVSSDGRTKWIRANGRTFYDDHDSPIRFDGLTIDITARVLAEQAIARNQKMFFDLVERCPYGVYIVDADFRLAVLNKDSLEGPFANVRPAIGRDFAEAMRIIWPEPLASELIATFRHTLETGEPYYSRDFVSPRGDIGEVEAYEWELHRIAMPDGRYGVVCYYYDSTELRQAELALREQQLFTQSIIEAAPSLTYIFDVESGRNVFVSSQVKDVLGYTQEEVARMGAGLLGTLLHPDDQQKAADRFNRIMASERDETFWIDYRMRHKSGRWVWLDDRARIFKRGDHGVPTQILAVTTDITERKEFEQRTADSEERFRLASDAARTLVYDSDLTGKRGVIAHGLERVTGFLNTDSDLSADWWRSLIHPDDLPAHAENFDRFLKAGGTYRTTYRVRRKDGEEIWVDETAQVTHDAAGTPVRVIGTIVDVTERRLAEEEMRRSNEREKAARVDAEQANRAKDEFLAVLSHELRTPLHSIKGWIALLRGGGLDAGQQRQGLEVIARNVEAQNALIEDILDVSRIVLGKLNLEKEVVSLSKTVGEAVEAMRPVAAAAGIRLATEIDEGVEAQADPFRIRQIVSNLVGNAIKFTPYGGAVNVRFERDGDRAVLTVADTGVGIAPDILPRIFDRFEQADGSRRRKYAGLGLGLAIVKHIAELHGGGITAESSGENLGATFTVELPLHTAENAAIHATNGHGSRDGEKPLSGIAVLLVDDDADALGMLEVALRSGGAETITAGSGVEALAQLRQRKFDFLLSDLGMPEMDGFDLIRKVRGELGIAPGQMPAMALSGYAGVGDRERSIESGYQFHAAKPVDLGSLPGLILSLTRGVPSNTEPQI